MTHRVTILPAAINDLATILEWVKSHSEQGAAAWWVRWNSALKSLAAMPASHGFAPEDCDHAQEIRQILFRTRRGQTYRALFTIQGDEIVVLRIRGSSQDLLGAQDLSLPDDDGDTMD